METLKIDRKKAIELYPKSSPEFKEVLESTFGKQCFSTNILDRINSFEDALAEKGMKPEDVIMNPNGPVRRIALDKLEFIIEVVNEGFIADYTNGNQKKWRPYFVFSSSGFGFSASVFNFTHTAAHCGSRLCMKDQLTCDHVRTKFQSLWIDLLTK